MHYPDFLLKQTDGWRSLLHFYVTQKLQHFYISSFNNSTVEWIFIEFHTMTFNKICLHIPVFAKTHSNMFLL
jgi:hypothetical protein